MLQIVISIFVLHKTGIVMIYQYNKNVFYLCAWLYVCALWSTGRVDIPLGCLLNLLKIIFRVCACMPVNICELPDMGAGIRTLVLLIEQVCLNASVRLNVKLSC